MRRLWGDVPWRLAGGRHAGHGTVHAARSSDSDSAGYVDDGRHGGGGRPPADAGADIGTDTTAATVEVRGTLLVAQPDRPGSRPAYAVALPDGDIVPVAARSPAPAPSPRSPVASCSPSPSSSTGAQGKRWGRRHPRLDLQAGRAALRLVDHRSQTLRVSGTPTLTRTAQPVTPTAHRQYVAAITNKGALGEDDRGLLGHVRKVGAYWRHQANGAISSIDVPAKVTRYQTR